MSRALRIVLVALMVGLMAQGAGATEDVSQASWFESVVQNIVSYFTESDASSTPADASSTPANSGVGDEPELGDLVDPFG